MIRTMCETLCNALNALNLSSVKSSRIDQIVEYVLQRTDERIQLLRHREVIQWLYDDTSFLNSKDKQNENEEVPKQNYYKDMKAQEDSWGRALMKTLRPDLGLKGQWTTCFGEQICKEIAILLGQNPRKPVKMNRFQPDIETDDAIWEVKTQTYYTTGTAGEKILGCPFKYADLPILYNKPLHIICIGGAEKVSSENYGNLLTSKTPSVQKKKFLDFFEECRIKYVACTDIFSRIIPQN